MFRAYKYRLYPTEKQEILLAKHFGCARFIWNWALEKKTTAYQLNKTKLSRFDLQAFIPILKKQTETEWLKEVNSATLQAKLEDLEKAFNSFFRKKTAYPKFKSKKNRQSFRNPQSTKFDFKNSKVSIPKFLEGIKITVDREFTGETSSSFIEKTCSGKYFISILVEDGTSIPEKPAIKEETTLGIDLGIRNFITTSSGLKVKYDKPSKTQLVKLAKEQRKLSKKAKGSKNRNKQRIKVAKLQEYTVNKRKDFQHKLAFKLTHDKQVDTICMETLSIKHMLENHEIESREVKSKKQLKELHRSISSMAWGMFVNILKNKCEWYGKNFIQIGRFEPSSKLCGCGFLNYKLKLSDKVWECPKCKAVNDRDLLAANNIKLIGLEQPESKASGPTLDLSGKAAQAVGLKEEASALKQSSSYNNIQLKQ